MQGRPEGRPINFSLPPSWPEEPQPLDRNQVL